MTLLRVLQYLVIANGVVLTLVAVRVIATYSAVWAMTPEVKRKQLPLHVWLIASSYLIYVASTTWLLVVTPVYGISRTIFYGAAGLIGQFALFNVLSYERRKLTAATSFQDQD